MALAEPEPPSWKRERDMVKERAGGAFRIHPLPKTGDELLGDCLSIVDEMKMDYVDIEEVEGKGARHDDGRKRHYALATISKKLQKQLDDMRAWKVELFNPQRVRKGIAPKSAVGVEHAALKFLGFVGKYAKNIPADDGLVYPLSLQIYTRDDLPMLLKQYCVWLREERQTMFSSLSNYMNSAVDIIEYCVAKMGVDPGAVDAAINLRTQADKNACVTLRAVPPPPLLTPRPGRPAARSTSCTGARTPTGCRGSTHSARGGTPSRRTRRPRRTRRRTRSSCPRCATSCSSASTPWRRPTCVLQPALLLSLTTALPPAARRRDPAVALRPHSEPQCGRQLHDRLDKVQGRSQDQPLLCVPAASPPRRRTALTPPLPPQTAPR